MARNRFIPEACYNLGRAFLTNGQPEKAIENFQTALRMDPNVADIHYLLAETLRQQGRIAEAVAHYEKALDLRPDSARACNSLLWPPLAAPGGGASATARWPWLLANTPPN